MGGTRRWLCAHASRCRRCSGEVRSALNHVVQNGANGYVDACGSRRSAGPRCPRRSEGLFPRAVSRSQQHWEQDSEQDWEQGSRAHLREIARSRPRRDVRSSARREGRHQPDPNHRSEGSGCCHPECFILSSRRGRQLLNHVVQNGANGYRARSMVWGNWKSGKAGTDGRSQSGSESLSRRRR